MRYRLTIEYMGTAYSGWQRQTNHPSVQQKVEEAAEDLFGVPIHVEGSGRTDTGVHALGQVAHFDTEKELPEYKLMLALNTRLPDDISIKKVEPMSNDFHARYSATQKTYLYKLYRSRTLSPTRRLTHARIPPNIDVEKMKIAASQLVGTHDFKGFSSTGSRIIRTQRTVYRAEVTEVGDEIHILINGNGFLYNMVRIIVGTLVYIGQGRLTENAVRTVLNTKNRLEGGKTFPPEGLYLESVGYDGTEPCAHSDLENDKEEV